jgi:hypothetical protein
MIASMRKHFSRRLGLAGAITAVATLVACGETSVSAPLSPGSISGVGTGALSGVAGRPLAEPVGVLVLGTDDQPLPRVQVSFAPAGDGALVEPATAVTDADGVARTRWTLAHSAGANTLTATAAGGVATTLTATGRAGRAASVSAAGGNNQTAAAGSPVPVAPSVRVVDEFGNPVENVAVSFSPLAGGGRVTGLVRSTNAQGVAAVGSWELGPTAGAQSLIARVEEPGVANNPVSFTATATAAAVAQLVVVAGNTQTAQINRPVPGAPTVLARDSRGNPMAGVVVEFTITAGGGMVIGSRQVTDAAGTAAVGGWFLGPAPGENTLRASSGGATAIFTAVANAGSAVSMSPNSVTTQTGVAGSPVPFPPSVVVRDFTGNPVPGVTVTFTVTAGGGGVQATSGGTVLTSAQVTTDAAGVATITAWRLGTAIVTNTLVASATGLPSVTFTATPGAGTAANVQAHAGQNGIALQGTAVPTPPAVRVTDANGNAVPNAEVVFSVTGGSGTITGATQRTDAAGVATVGSWILGGGAPPNRLRATVTGTGVAGNPVDFTAQAAGRIGVTSVPAGSVTLGQNFSITAQLQNAANAAVELAGVSLTLSIASGGGTLNGTTTVATGAGGSATFTVNVTGTAGARTFSIAGSSLPAGAVLAPVTTSSITIN